MQMMMLGAPDVDVLGITTVTGNVWANRASAIALRGVDVSGRTDVPVVQGAPRRSSIWAAVSVLTRCCRPPRPAISPREYVNTPRREFIIRFDPEAASIVLRSPWKHVTLVPVDPAAATQLSTDMRGRLAKAAKPDAAKVIAAMEPGFPLWDEVAAGVWLDPKIVTTSESLFVDANTQFGADYGDLLSWDVGHQPGLGEQPADVVRAIDPAKLEVLVMRLMTRRVQVHRHS